MLVRVDRYKSMWAIASVNADTHTHTHTHISTNFVLISIDGKPFLWYINVYFRFH